MTRCTVLIASALAGLAVSGLSSPGPARAADMPVKATYAPAPVYNWYGFYVGGHAGLAWSRDSVDYVAATGGLLIGTNVPASLTGDASGFMGGIHWGSNYQFDRIVLGLESDFSFMDLDRTGSATLAGVTTTASHGLDWFGTTRVRAGYVVHPTLLVYATGGLANGRAEVSSAHVGGGFAGGATARDTLWGWALGAGIEYAAGPWLFRVEYLHYDLGDLDYAYAVAPAATVTTSTNVSGDIVRAGLSYKFNWTPLDILLGRRTF
ncbi:MAG: outer membrane beta-barrel protein [Xanthobacteraceae bacterium]|nr:outer membrane beta-barrel protein [Xanthobacteraceae bacterium]